MGYDEKINMVVQSFLIWFYRKKFCYIFGIANYSRKEFTIELQLSEPLGTGPDSDMRKFG